MKRTAMLFQDKYKVVFETSEIGTLSDTEVLVENIYSLISPGTELALFMGTHVGFQDPEIIWARYPIAPGYASVGRIVDIGKNVSNFKIGEYLFHYGTHASHSVINLGNALHFRVNPDADLVKVLFGRFAQISYTAAAASQRETGNVLVYGGGMIGNLCAQIFKTITQRRVFVADLSEDRLKVARDCGLETIHLQQGDLKSMLHEISQGAGFDTVVEATGVPSVVSDCLRTVNEHGEVMLLGSTRGYVEIDLYKNVHRKFLNIYGVHENRYPKFGSYPSQKTFGERAIQFINEGKLKVDSFITDHIEPPQAEQAYGWLINDKDHHLGIVIHWEGLNER
jgi:2-desacetyl-2-hydroxyethyl bacteriochlorophyllide A dehydrogenase